MHGSARGRPLGLRLALFSSALVALTAVAVGWGMVRSARADLHAELEARGGAVARGLALLSAEPLRRGDAARLRQLLDGAWEEAEIARAEVVNVAGEVVAARDFPGEASASPAVVSYPVTGPMDADGFREAIGLVRITLSGASVARREARYVEQATQVALWTSLAGVLVATLLGWLMVAPLRRLARATRRVADGDYPEPDAIPLAGPREVRALGRSLREAVAEVARREARLREVNDALRRTERARDAMTHMLVHDLKGPLSNVQMLLDVLADGSLPAEDRDLVVQCKARCVGLLEHVEDLLALGRMESGRMTLDLARVAAGELVEAALADVEGLAKRRGFSIERAVDAVEVLGDRRLLRRALVNLLINAVRHGRSPVRVEVRADAEAAHLVVQDAGEGIPPDAVDRAFEKFARLEGATGEGTGLGLAFVRLAARAHGGDAYVDGARFELVLPRQPESSAKVAA